MRGARSHRRAAARALGSGKSDLGLRFLFLARRGPPPWSRRSGGRRPGLPDPQGLAPGCRERPRPSAARSRCAASASSRSSPPRTPGGAGRGPGPAGEIERLPDDAEATVRLLRPRPSRCVRLSPWEASAPIQLARSPGKGETRRCGLRDRVVDAQQRGVVRLFAGSLGPPRSGRIVGLFLKSTAKLEPELGRLTSAMLHEIFDRGPDSAGFAVYTDANPGITKICVVGPRGPTGRTWSTDWRVRSAAVSV